MSNDEVKIAINNTEVSFNMEGLWVTEQTKALCERLLVKEISMEEYISLVKQKAGVTI